MNNNERCEKLLYAWVKLSGMLKNTRITKGLMYNESVVMLYVYKQYCKDNEGIVSVKKIVAETKMLKSLVNRTVNSLVEKKLLQRCDGSGDKRVVYVKCVKENLDVFLDVHNDSLTLAQGIIEVIGEKDAETFIGMVEKLNNAGYKI